MTDLQVQRARVLGLPVDLIDEATAVRRLLRLAQARESLVQVVTLNAEMVMRAQADPELADAIGRAGLVIPDGAGIVWALRRQGHRLQRLPGIDLILRLFDRAAQLRCFFLGSDSSVVLAAARNVQHRHRGVQVVGTHHGYFAPEDEASVIERIRAASPQVLLVALGVPRQEKWIARHQRALEVPVCIGVGGTLDVLAGRVRRAPAMLRRVHLEWLYRLYREPWRWRRMQDLPRFVRAVRESEKEP